MKKIKPKLKTWCVRKPDGTVKRFRTQKAAQDYVTQNAYILRSYVQTVS